LLEIYAYHVLVDQFGDTPYSEALMGAENSRPAYDDASAAMKCRQNYSGIYINRYG
jgi:hypothetical protein